MCPWRSHIHPSFRGDLAGQHPIASGESPAQQRRGFRRTRFSTSGSRLPAHPLSGLQRAVRQDRHLWHSRSKVRPCFQLVGQLGLLSCDPADHQNRNGSQFFTCSLSGLVVWFKPSPLIRFLTLTQSVTEQGRQVLRERYIALPAIWCENRALDGWVERTKATSVLFRNIEARLNKEISKVGDLASQ